MSEQKHYDLYLSGDWDEKIGVITTIPPLSRYALHTMGNALRSNLELLETEESRWGAGAAEGQSRFSQKGIKPNTLTLASEFICDLLVGQGHAVTVHYELAITDSGFFNPNA